MMKFSFKKLLASSSLSVITAVSFNLSLFASDSDDRRHNNSSSSSSSSYLSESSGRDDIWAIMARRGESRGENPQDILESLSSHLRARIGEKGFVPGDLSQRLTALRQARDEMAQKNGFKILDSGTPVPLEDSGENLTISRSFFTDLRIRTEQIRALEIYEGYTRTLYKEPQISIENRLSLCAESQRMLRTIEEVIDNRGLAVLLSRGLRWELSQYLQTPLSKILFTPDKSSEIGFTVESLDTLSSRFAGVSPNFEDSRLYIRGYPYNVSVECLPHYKAFYEVVYSYIGYTPLQGAIGEEVFFALPLPRDLCILIGAYALPSVFQEEDPSKGFSAALPMASSSPASSSPARAHERAAIDFMVSLEVFRNKFFKWNKSLAVYKRFATENAFLAQGRLEGLFKDPDGHPSEKAVRAVGQEWETAKEELSLLTKLKEAVRKLGNRDGFVS